MENVKVLFVEDYKAMTKTEFETYVKKIYNEGYQDGYEKGSQLPYLNTWPSNAPITPYYTTTSITNAVSDKEI